MSPASSTIAVADDFYVYGKASSDGIGKYYMGEKFRMSWFSAEHCRSSFDAPVNGLAGTGRTGWADLTYP
jgi:hypothetical protein